MTNVFEQAMAGENEMRKLDVGEQISFMFKQMRSITTKYGDAIVFDGLTPEREDVSILMKKQMLAVVGEAMRQAGNLTELGGVAEPESGSVITLKRVQDVKTSNDQWMHIHEATYQRPAGAAAAPAAAPVAEAPAPAPAPAPVPAAAPAPAPAASAEDFFA